MNQHEARTRELQQLLYAAVQPDRPTTERRMCYRRFRDICDRYHIDPASFKVPKTPPPGPRKVRKLPDPKPARDLPVPGSGVQSKPKPATAHANCTHGNSKTARAKCRRHREKAEEAKKESTS